MWSLYHRDNIHLVDEKAVRNMLAFLQASLDKGELIFFFKYTLFLNVQKQEN